MSKEVQTGGAKRPSKLSVEICVLAAGLSARMGRDKAKLRIGRHTLLGRIRATATQTGYPVRIIRRDLVPQCGPLGGIYTAFAETDVDTIPFLACDMPFVSEEFLRKIIKASSRTPALFTETDSAGFPFVLSRSVLPIVEKQMAAKEFALHRLVKKLKAGVYRPTAAERGQLLNINTPADLDAARRQLDSLRSSPVKRSSSAKRTKKPAR